MYNIKNKNAMNFRATLTTLAIVVAAYSLGSAQQSEPQFISCTFTNNLLYVKAQSVGGALTFFANTAGGSFLLEEGARRVGMVYFTDESGNTFVDLDGLLAPAGLPLTGKSEALLLPYGQGDLDCGADGTLGQSWFGQYCWSIDYPGQQLSCYQPPLSPLEAHTIPVSFMKDRSGARVANFPRLMVEIDGQAIPMILDTGAKLLPTSEASRAMGDSTLNAPIAASFIIESIFEEWQQAHPDWKVVEQADQELGNVKMIEVPSITVAGQEVGPVWFCSRADDHYLAYFSRFTGQAVMGALGGSGLQHFKVTLDYPNALAKFEKDALSGRHIAGR